MPLKTLVKVGSITNLSDARYCAGMGVDFLGFRVIEDTENYIEPGLYQQIRGWVSGPKFVAEFYGIKESTNVENILSSFVPDYIELTLNEYLTHKKKFRAQFIVSLGDNEKILLKEIPEDIAFWSVSSLAPDQSIIRTGKPVLYKPHQKNAIDTVLSSGHFSGISLDGSAEERPGYKSYDDLAEILEKLDE